MSAAIVAADAGSVPLLGGELLTESDADGGEHFGDWLLPLLAPALPTTGTTLVVGRCDDTLLTALAARGTRVDLVLRSLPDARAARIRLAAAGVRVRCGGLERIPADGGYDALCGTVEVRVFQGDATRYRVAIAGDVLLDVTVPAVLDTRYECGDKVRVDIDPGALQVLPTEVSAG